MSNITPRSPGHDEIVAMTLAAIYSCLLVRRAHPELGPSSSLEILHDGYPLAYLRGGRFLVIVNPGGRARVLPHDRPELAPQGDVRR
jgi:hypothetical protein